MCLKQVHVLCHWEDTPSFMCKILKIRECVQVLLHVHILQIYGFFQVSIWSDWCNSSSTSASWFLTINSLVCYSGSLLSLVTLLLSFEFLMLEYCQLKLWPYPFYCTQPYKLDISLFKEKDSFWKLFSCDKCPLPPLNKKIPNVKMSVRFVYCMEINFHFKTKQAKSSVTGWEK